MKLLLFLLILLGLVNSSHALLINEIMADPIADESLNEWIELYNNESTSINVSGWVIGDDNDNDTLEGGLYDQEGTIIGPYGFAIITDEATRVYNNFNTSNDAIRLYVDDGAIGNGLINSGETFYLYDNNNNLIDKVTYNETKEDLSWSFINGSFFISELTPGYNNNGSITLSSEDGCDYAVVFILAKTMFDNSSDFTFKIRASKVTGTTTNFTSRAKIEDLNGRLIKEYKPFTNTSITRQRTTSTYTPNLEEGKSYILEANITSQCNDTIIDNNLDTQIITIKGTTLPETSAINIETIYDLGIDKKAKFGQTIRIKLNAYKGNTNKASVAVWIERKDDRVSKQSKTNLAQKYTNYSLTLPIQIKPNCDEGFKDGRYTIVAQGLDTEDEKEIEIEELTDSMCDVKIIEAKQLSSKNFNFELMDFNNKLNLGKEFKTKVMLDNNNDQDIDIKTWSYVYRGSKSYSGEREENMDEFTLKANSLQIVELSNIVKDITPGNYKLKVLVNKDNQKTNNEITKDITIGTTTKNIDSSEDAFIIEESENNKITNNVVNYGQVYESSTEKTKNLAPLFIITLSVLLNIALIWKR
tara:strand:+ start:130 stop:1887 length:1758 start_codon:yes stop_codon:yes gene_type:complete